MRHILYVINKSLISVNFRKEPVAITLHVYVVFGTCIQSIIRSANDFNAFIMYSLQFDDVQLKFFLEYLAEAEFLSVDPYMRAGSNKLPKGITMVGQQVAKIIESKNPEFPVGKRIIGYMGWRTHTIVNQKDFAKPETMNRLPIHLPDLGEYSPSLGLGALGMIG